MKTLESDPRWYFRPFNRLLNRLAVDTDRISSDAIAIGSWGRYATRGEFWVDKFGVVIHPNQMQSMIWNARWFKRWVYVDGKFRGLAWSRRPEGADYKHTVILGTKINGRQAITIRLWHSDEASMRGTLGANSGQATGDRFGPA